MRKLTRKKKVLISTAILILGLNGLQGAYAAIDDSTTAVSVGAGETHTATGTSYVGGTTMTAGVGVLQATGANAILDATGVSSVVENGVTTPDTHAILANNGGEIKLGTLTVTGNSGTTWATRGGIGIYSLGAGSKITSTGDVTINTVGGVSYGGAYGLMAENGGNIEIGGNLTVTTNGTDSAAVKATASGSTITLNDLKTTTKGANAHGINASNGGTVVAKQVDITVKSNWGENYAYGILADVKNSNGSISTVTIDGGSIVQDGSISQSGSGLRALDSGIITVNDTLIISTNGIAARGIYASESGVINLNNTTVTTTGLYSHGIQLGKSRNYGTGFGVVNSKGDLIINSNVSSGGIYVEGNNSQFNGDFATSSTIINAKGRAIVYGGGADVTLDADSNSLVSINNGNINTSHNTYDLIYVGGRNVGSSLNLRNSTATAGVGGWLLNAVDTTITDGMGAGPVKGSVFTLNTDKTQLNGSINKEDLTELTVNLNNNSIWNIVGRSGSLDEISTMTALDINESTINAFAAGLGNYTLKTNVSHTGGTINLSDGTGTAGVPGDILTIDGNYTINGGSVAIDTELGADNSKTDKLVVTGDTSGSGYLLINNAGGLGALTNKGIEVIQVGGASDASFELGNAVQIGLCEYILRQEEKDWYLQSFIKLEETEKPIYRPGVANYVAGQMANTEQGFLSIGSLHQRIGEQRLAESGKQPWVRYYGSIQNNQGHHRFDYKQYINGVQVGLDIYQNDSEKRTIRSGLLLDYSASHANFGDSVRPQAGLYRGSGSMENDTYGIGGYYTRINKNGSYVDFVGLISKLENDFTDSYGGRGSQDAYRLALSAEAGKEFARTGDWHYEAQGQLIYQYTDYDSFRDKISRVNSYSADNLRARLGLRVYKDVENKTKNRKMNVYGIANLVQDFINPETITIDGVGIRERFDKTYAEIGIGAQLQLKKNTFLYLDARYEKSLEGGKESRKLNFGFKTSF